MMESAKFGLGFVGIKKAHKIIAVMGYVSVGMAGRCRMSICGWRKNTPFQILRKSMISCVMLAAHFDIAFS